jgi:hypothetical protein
MVRLMEFDAPTEERVRFVEDTPRDSIIDKTIDRLEGGEDPKLLVTAAALAVSRSCELPADHHGGPVHPVAGIHAITGMLERLSGEHSLLPVLQCVALANKHIHLPSMGQTVMVQFEKLNRNAEKKTVLSRLEQAMGDHEGRLAERWLTIACEKATPGEILNALMSVAIRRNSLDDHYFLYAVYACRALDAIGWQHGPVLLRPAVRFLARHHSFEPYGEFDEQFVADGIDYFRRFTELEALAETYGLDEERVRLRADTDESDAVEALATKIGEVKVIATLPETIAAAMGAGLSLYGTIEAISIGGARVFLRSHTNNPFDVHIHTGTAARRYLLGFDEISMKHKVMSLLGWAWGYEVRYLDHTLQWDWCSDDGVLSQLGPNELLKEIERLVLGIDGYDVTNLSVSINNLVAPDEVRQAVRLAESYVKAGYDVNELFTLSASLVCREDASEMHGYKLQQASFEEYAVCNPSLRWVHAVAAVKQAAVNAPTKPHRFYPQIVARLAAA